MYKVMKKFFSVVVSLLALGTVFAGGAASPVSNSKMSADFMPPISSNGATYTFDQTGVKSMLAKTSSLLQVNCNGVALLKNL